MVDQGGGPEPHRDPPPGREDRGAARAPSRLGETGRVQRPFMAGKRERGSFCSEWTPPPPNILHKKQTPLQAPAEVGAVSGFACIPPPTPLKLPVVKSEHCTLMDSWAIPLIYRGFLNE